MRGLTLFLVITGVTAHLTAAPTPVRTAAASPSLAQARTVPRHSARAFFETTSYGMAAAGGHAFSHDGTALLVSSDQTGVFNVYRVPVAGGRLEPLTASTTSAMFAESFFPGDDRVLVSGDQGGNELTHVYVRERDGALRDLAPGDKVKASFLRWSPDGRTFYLLSNARDAKSFDVVAVDATSYQSRIHYRNDGFEVGALSRDGRHVALVKPRTSADSDVYLAAVATGAPPRLVTEHRGNVEHRVYDFTHDGAALIYGTDEHGEFRQAWTYDLQTGRKASLVAAEWDVMLVQDSPQGRYRVSALNVDASTDVRIEATGGRRLTLQGVPAGDLGAVRFDARESLVAFRVASDTSPADIFVASLADGKARRLTTALNPAIDERDLVEATVARFKSRDGVEIPGILYQPRQAGPAQKVPAVVLVHGGPGGQSWRGYSAMVQHLVNNGYGVYAINNRGSSGYGKTFYHLDDKKHGDVDLKDVVESRAFLASLPWVDGSRVAVMGGSYGGYMVAAALAFAPDAFDAGIDIFGVTNWTRTLQSIPAWWAAARESLYDEMGDPATDAERHRAISPLFHAKNIRKPLLVVQGANDPRVLKVESDELVAAVKANGVAVEYLVFPDEGHGFLKRENRIAASDAYLKFLDTHLKAGRATTSSVSR